MMYTVKNAGRALTMLVLCMTLGACTTRNWYEGVRMSAEADCNRLEPAARAECRAKVNKTPYDDYEKERARNKP
jgi:hypothetical protein